MKERDVDSFQSLSLEFDNFDEFNQSVQGWSADFKQVDRGIASVRLRHRMTPLINALDVRFTHSTSSVGSPTPGHRTFGMVDKDDGATWCGHDVFANQMLRFDAHDDFFTFTPRGFIGRTLSIDESLLSDIAGRLGYHDFIDKLDKSKDVLDIDPLAIGRFRKLYDRPKKYETELLDVAESLVILLSEHNDRRARSWERNGSKLLDDALSFITANARDAITVADICSSLGVGCRRLHRVFRRQLGHGPKDSILACRLNGARADLRASEPNISVSDIANDWGFWHMGDFARIYRAEFGELPSETSRSA